jgi:exonuclease SbcC
LQSHGFSDSKDYEAADTNDRPRRETLQQLQNQRVEWAKTSSALCEREAAALVELQAACPLQEGEASEALAEKLEQVTAVRNEQNELLTGVLAALRVDDLAREANAGIKMERERLERERNQHALLKKVLGDSQDGFKKFAQQITFDLLLERANVELRKFTNRYELRRSSKDKKLLDISVIDHELGIVEGRTVSNLSGGETFLVSLSLALGLSHLSQATRIDSLFLDEGFGTLDADTLEQVISSLQKLHETGKTIGIISHVPALSERIAARIEVQRTREGFSTLTGNPAVTCKKSA